MIIGAAHWVLALAIAVSVHLAGIVWISLTAPAHQELEERASTSIVVTLGRAASRTAAEAARPDSTEAVDAADTDAVPQPSTVDEAPGPETPEAEPAPAVTEAAAADAAEPVTPSTQRPGDPEPAPESQPAGIEAAAVSPDPVTASEAEDVELAETTTARPTTEAAPASAAAAVQAPSAQAKAQDVPIPPTPSMNTEPAVDEPAVFADDAPMPEPAPSETDIAQASTEAADVSGIEPSPAPTVPQVSSSVENAAAVQAEAAAPAQAPESVGSRSADEASVEVAAARPPEAAVESTSEPDISEAIEPEVMDLQALQDSSAGTGVAARYAGVLKGWLQRNMHYPRAARLAGQEGRVIVRFVIDRAGNVQSIELESKSGFPLLDREAREMIERGDPFPGLPKDMAGQQLEVRVPINFDVRDETLTKEIPPIYLE